MKPTTYHLYERLADMITEHRTEACRLSFQSSIGKVTDVQANRSSKKYQ